MQVVSVILAVILAAIYILAVCRFLRSNPEGSQEEAQDPCVTCLRWSECNGVEMETCPLWEVDYGGEI